MISPPEAVTGQSIRRWAIRLANYLKSERIVSGKGILIKQTAGGRTISAMAETHEYPLQVYLSGGYICVRSGHHIWFDSYANVPAKTDLEKDVGDAWQAYTSGARTVYVKRIYNSDGTATVTLENTADSYATVAGGITNTEARWILATIADGVITQWWTGGDIYDIRVA